MLTLPIKKRWLELIRKGEKTEEYREISPFYAARFEDKLGDKITLRLRNGYSLTAATTEITALVSKGTGRKEWGAEPGREYYILRILEKHDILPEVFIVKARRCKRCGGLLTSAQAVKDGYGHTCKIKNNADAPDEAQMTIQDLITALNEEYKKE